MRIKRITAAPCRTVSLIASCAALLASAAGSDAKDAEPFPLSCFYAKRISLEADTIPHCARIDGDFLRIAPAQVRDMSFDHGLSEAAIEGFGWAHVDRDGRALPVLTFDNGPDPFSHGLTRARRNGKIGFFDREFNLVLATSYDWASEFDARGRAAVCLGCASDGTEMGFMVGGLWGIIDRSGQVVTPVVFTREALSKLYFEEPAK